MGLTLTLINDALFLNYHGGSENYKGNYGDTWFYETQHDDTAEWLWECLEIHTKSEEEPSKGIYLIRFF